MAYLMLQNLKTFLKYFFKIYELKINHSPLLSSHSSPPRWSPSTTVDCSVEMFCVSGRKFLFLSTNDSCSFFFSLNVISQIISKHVVISFFLMTLCVCVCVCVCVSRSVVSNCLRPHEL